MPMIAKDGDGKMQKRTAATGNELLQMKRSRIIGHILSISFLLAVVVSHIKAKSK